MHVPPQTVVTLRLKRLWLSRREILSRGCDVALRGLLSRTASVQNNRVHTEVI